MSDQSVESYNLSEADSLKLHIKVGYEPQSDAQRTGPATHSFGSDGYGFFVSVLTPDGKLLFRPKVFPDEAATRLIAEAGSKLRDSLGKMRLVGGRAPRRTRRRTRRSTARIMLGSVEVEAPFE